VTIIPNGRSFGRLNLYPKGRLTFEESLGRIVLYDAGHAATKLLTAGRDDLEEPLPDGSVRLWSSGNDHDLELSTTLIKRLAAHYGREADPFFFIGMLGLYSQTSTRILCRRWPAVVRVAEELLQKKTLKEARVYQLLGPSFATREYTGE
jgi:hypothetical protein